MRSLVTARSVDLPVGKECSRALRSPGPERSWATASCWVAEVAYSGGSTARNTPTGVGWATAGQLGQHEGEAGFGPGLVVHEDGLTDVGHVDHPGLAVGAHDHAPLAVLAEAHGLAVLERDEHGVAVGPGGERLARPSLKTLQFWKISTKAAPLWSWARRNVSIMCWRSMSWVRATNVASAPRATAKGLNGASSEPIGVDLVTLPSSRRG